MFDYFLMGQYPSEEDMALVREGKATTPVGTPRPASEFAWPPAPLAAASAPAGSASMPLASVSPAQSIAAAFLPQGVAPAQPAVQALPAASSPSAAASAIKPVSVRR